ncbi:4'-phosphopantetheinyl transferase family protein [Actinokineospora spheciospongiae]|uniref:4'-phosphopantetheinyl transferase family protein n=1 Tax=Actinokineospora spheciospongiae TaxID=909613 RepID=UPI000D7176BA|nr:4'-phosphopantetheinyl transferase superfamily protein [Actinokineospora spheciospongiae]PWW52680.1 4'-phosphopantetheinyl transferase [Actinokineospora spheciospongiae]
MTSVHVWLVPDLPDAVLDRLEGVLDPEERRRAAALDPPRRREFVAAHGAARAVVGRRLGLAPAEVRWRIGAHGKPEVPGVSVSLSRSAGVAMVALTRDRPLGVDLQRLLHTDAVRTAERFFAAEEAHRVRAAAAAERPALLTRLLTRKEACVKAAGGRLFPGLRRAVLDRDMVGEADGGRYRVRDLTAPAGFAAAVAVGGTAPYRVRAHRWHERETP